MADGELKEEAGADITEKKGGSTRLLPSTSGLLHGTLYKSPPLRNRTPGKINALPLRVERRASLCRAGGSLIMHAVEMRVGWDGMARWQVIADCPG